MWNKSKKIQRQWTLPANKLPTIHVDFIDWPTIYKFWIKPSVS